MSDHRKIVWIASYPKSGSTWFRMFLDAYFLEELDINEVVTSVTDDRADRCQINDGSDLTKLPIDIQQLARPMGLLRMVRAFNGQIPLYVKTHNALMLANGFDLLPEMLTKAVIHIVRDPRDVLPSFAKHMGVDNTQALEWMGDRYRVLNGGEGRMADFVSSWDAHTNSFLNSDSHNVATFLYEDMRLRPVETFSAMLTHSGIDPDPARVEKALERCSLSRLKAQEAKSGFIESSPHAKDQFFGEGKTGGTQLTDVESLRVGRKFGRVMKRLGYLKKKAA